MSRSESRQGRRGPHAQVQERKEVKRGEILDAAARLFSVRGYQSTSMADLAEALGVTKPAIYYYIATKEELLDALFDRALTGLETALDEARNSTIDPIERVRRVIHAHILEATHDNRTLLVFVQSGAGRAEGVASANESNRLRALRYTLDVASLIEHGQSVGAIRSDFDARLAAAAIIGMCNWVAVWYHSGGPHSPEQIAEQHTRLVVESLAAPAR